MLIANWMTFRHTFGVKHRTTGASLTFANANPDTITRAAGDFTADGYEAGMVLLPDGAASNDVKVTIASVAASVITLSADDAVTAEGPVTANLLGYWEDPDGVIECPGALSHLQLVAPPSALTLTLDVSSNFKSTVTWGAGSADAVFGTDEFDWYLSQRTDDLAKQWLLLEQKPSVGTSSFSGTVVVTPSALAISEFGLSGANLTLQQLIYLFRFAHLYVKRRSDGIIQWFDLLVEHLRLAGG
jgi:hypothetical protein